MLLVVLLVASTVTMAFTAISARAANNDFELPEVPVAQESQNSAHWVDATYFDYLSDAEMGRENTGENWLRPEKSGTGYDGSRDDWYPYDKFNKLISDNSRGWTYPLYLGNFCNNFDSYPNAEKTHGGPYSTVVSKLNNFNYFVTSGPICS